MLLHCRTNEFVKDLITQRNVNKKIIFGCNRVYYTLHQHGGSEETWTKQWSNLLVRLGKSQFQMLGGPSRFLPFLDRHWRIIYKNYVYKRKVLFSLLLEAQALWVYVVLLASALVGPISNINLSARTSNAFLEVWRQYLDFCDRDHVNRRHYTDRRDNMITNVTSIRTLQKFWKIGMHSYLSLGACKRLFDVPYHNAVHKFINDEIALDS